MDSAANSVLVVTEGCGEGCWELHGSDQQFRMSAAPEIQNGERLCSFAETLSLHFGGPCVRAVVFISNRSRTDQADTQEPVILARYPRLVCRMGRSQALAHAAPAEWTRFLTLERSTEWSCSLFCRTGAALVEQKLMACSAPELINIARALRIERCLLGSSARVSVAADEQEIARTLELRVAPDDAAIAGARACASELIRNEGLCFERNRRTSIRALRPIEYSVFHPSRAVFDLEEKTLAEVAGSRQVLLVADLKLEPLYASLWRKYAQRHLHLSAELLLDISEQSKAWSQVYDICAIAARAGLPRNGIILGVGGGVTLDVAGLAASVFRRGVDYIRVPTTLVGLVDVAVGIKQGVNAHGKKNLVGTFYPPLASINDYRFAQSLHPREIACGMAEILKVALLRDPVLLKLLESHGAELFCSGFSTPEAVAAEVANRAELLMMEELAPNLFEKSLARLVDFGHTFSPSIETLSRFEIPHGYAVGFDMLISTALAAARGMADPTLLARLTSLLKQLGLPVWDHRIPQADALASGLADVRRHRGGSLNLVVIARPGAPEFIQSVSRGELETALELVRECAGVHENAAGGLDVDNYAGTAV